MKKVLWTSAYAAAYVAYIGLGVIIGMTLGDKLSEAWSK